LKKTLFSKSLAISFYIVIGIFIFVWIFFIIQTNKFRNIGESSINTLSDKIFAENEKNFRATSEEIVIDKTSCLAQTIKYYLRNKGKLHHLSTREIVNLQNDPEFNKIVSQKIGKNGYAVIIEDRGIIICHPEKRMLNLPVSELIKMIPEFDPIFKNALQDQKASGYYLWKEENGKRKNKFLAAARIEKTNLFVLTTMLLDELFEPIASMNKANIASIEEYKSVLNKGLIASNSLLALVLTLSLIITAIIVYLGVKTLTKPILKLTSYAQELGKGNFNYQLDVKTGDEIEFLSQKLREMALNLKDYYARLEEVNKKLKQANDNLATIDKAKSEFISIASHELKTPLTIIRGFTDVIKSEAIKEGSEHCMNQIKNFDIIIAETDRLSQMVEEFLDISQIESGLMSVDITEIKIQEIINKIVGLFSLKETKHIFKIEIAEDLTAIFADRQLIEHLLTNLISNAVNYSPEKTTITITGKVSGKNIVVSVLDEGIGIEKESLSKVFTKLYREKQDERVKKVKGIGLGLAITKGIIEIHHGKIWAESEGLNKGSKFIFTLPIKQKEMVITTEVRRFLGV